MPKNSRQVKRNEKPASSFFVSFIRHGGGGRNHNIRRIKIMKIREIYSEREVLLRKNGYGSYEEYLESDEWKKIKKSIRSRKGAKWRYCNICGIDENLDVHHSSYKVIGSINPGNTVKILCRDCHQELHELCKKMDLDFYQAFRHIRAEREKARKPVFIFYAAN